MARRLTPTSVRLPEDIDTWLDDQAAAKGIPRSEIIVSILRAYMDGRIVKAKGAAIRQDI